MTRLLRSSLLALSVAVALSACGDPYKPQASRLVATDTIVARAISTPVSYLPTAITVDGPAAVHAGGSDFDLAFDVDSLGRPVLVPISKLVIPCPTARATCAIGVHRDSTQKPFDSLTVAPGGGYVYDSVTVIQPGVTYFVQSRVARCNSLYEFSQIMYGKLVVDSVRLADSTFYGRVTSDNNCGFRSLEPDKIPAK